MYYSEETPIEEKRTEGKSGLKSQTFPQISLIPENENDDYSEFIKITKLHNRQWSEKEYPEYKNHNGSCWYII